MDSTSSKKRVRHDSAESELNSVDAKRILLDILDDSDVCTPSHDLDSFMKTLQSELSSPSPPVPVQEIAGKNSGERPELGFLFEASDDELGLPPTETDTRVLAESVGLGELWGLDEEFLGYDSFQPEFIDDGDDVNNFNYNSGEYVALDGLFDLTDVGFGSSDLTWRGETLPAQ